MTALLAIAHTGQVSGAEAVLLRALIAARRRGWTVRCVGPPGPLALALAQHDIPHVPLPELSLGAGPAPVAAAALAAATAAAARRIRRVSRDMQADVVLVNGLLGLPAARLARVAAPIVWLVHDVLRRADRLAVLRGAAPSVDLAIAVSEAAASAPRAAGIRTTVVRNGTRWPVDAAPQPPPSPPVVGCVAALTSWKGQDVLLEAARLLPPGVHVELAGASFPKDGEYVTRLHAMADGPELAGRVRFLGRVDDPLECMRQWAVCVSPSVDPEAGPLHVLEAMSVGVPLIGTDHGGTPEVLDGAGVLVPPGDPAALAAAIDRLLTDIALHRSCAKAGPLLVAERYQASARVDELLDTVEAAAQPTPRGRLRHLTVLAVPDYLPRLGGTTSLTANQAETLLHNGHDVVVLTRRAQDGLARHESVNGVAVVRLGRPGEGRLAAKLTVLSMVIWLARRRARVGAFHAVMYPDFAAAAALAGLGSRSAMTWAGEGDATDTLGHPGHRAAGLSRLRRRLLARVTHVALTPRLAHELAEVGVEGDVRVMPIPVDLAHFHPPQPKERDDARRHLGIDKDELVVTFTGHLRTLKAVDRLIEAVAQLRERDLAVRLLVVGGGRGADDDQDLELQQQAAPLGAAVTFTGAVGDVVPYLWASDVFVLPSTREGFPNSLLEAMACGLACVAPASAAGDQVLTPATGVVPPTGSAEALADAIADLAAAPERREALGRAAALAARRYGLESFAGTYTALIDELERQ
ncbi:MAG: hypothetical protein QOG03_2102 [Actinomycetota bacterium]|jgi:glycosyltransferase involved in cell wall biosynthesis|nr:hypothetical protein [Actinomycetota bacterium]